MYVHMVIQRFEKCFQKDILKMFIGSKFHVDSKNDVYFVFENHNHDFLIKRIKIYLFMTDGVTFTCYFDFMVQNNIMYV